MLVRLCQHLKEPHARKAEQPLSSCRPSIRAGRGPRSVGSAVWATPQLLLAARMLGFPGASLDDTFHVHVASPNST